MSVLLWVLLFITVFWTVVISIGRRYDLRRYGITFESGVLMWRTKLGLKLIDRIARAWKRGWLVFGTVGVVVGFILMIVIFTLLTRGAIFILQKPEAKLPGAVPVIPGITIPLIYGLIAVFTVLVVHEFAHGLMIRTHGIQTKSTGFLLFIILPGAFVEPDEKQLKNAPLPNRLRVFGAGPFANVLFGLVCFSILLFAIVPKPGIYVFGTIENGPSETILKPGDRLIGIDNVMIKDYGGFNNFMRNVRENDQLAILVERDGREFLLRITAVRHPYEENRGYIGVMLTYARETMFYAMDPFFEIIAGRQFAVNPYCYDARAPWELIDLLRWVAFLHFGIGLFNLLPALPLDGGYICRSIVEQISSKRIAKCVSYALSFIALILILVNLAPLLLG